MALTYVIDSATGLIKRWGYCDFSLDGTIVAGEEQISSKDEKHPDVNTEQNIRYYHKSDDTIRADSPI